MLRKSQLPICTLVLGCVLCIAGACTARAQSSAYEEALEKYQNKDYPSALSAAERALQQDNNPSYWHIYGLTLAAVRRFAEAEDNLCRSIELKPGDANFHYDLGYVLYRQKNYDQALTPLKRAVELNGDNLMARFLLGRVYVSAHRTLLISHFSQLALEQFEFIGQKNPRFPSLHYHMALIYINNGNRGGRFVN